MEISSFLQKDIGVFLDNVIKFGTAENKAVEDELSSLLSKSPSSADVSSSSNQKTETKPSQVNVTIAKDMVDSAIKEVKEEPNPTIPEPVVKDSDKENTKDPKIPLPSGDELAKEKTIDDITGANSNKQELIKPVTPDEIDSQLAKLEDVVSSKDLSNTLKLYNHLKLLGTTITLSDKQKSRLYSSLKKAAEFLLEKRDEKIKSVDVSSLENYELKHENKQISPTNKDPFLIPEYIKALEAIKEYDKIAALELLVPLSKQYPKNISIKRRLREALTL